MRSITRALKQSSKPNRRQEWHAASSTSHTRLTSILARVKQSTGLAPNQRPDRMTGILQLDPTRLHLRWQLSESKILIDGVLLRERGLCHRPACHSSSAAIMLTNSIRSSAAHPVEVSGGRNKREESLMVGSSAMRSNSSCRRWLYKIPGPPANLVGACCGMDQSFFQPSSQMQVYFAEAVRI